MSTDLKCAFCDSTQLQRSFMGLSHPIIINHGPFDLYVCSRCNSLTTYPLPSHELLQSFYSHFNEGMPDELREARKDSSQSAIYRAYLQRIKKHINTKDFKWLEIGAGGGEFAQIFAEEYPDSHGVCVDFHPRPSSVWAQNVTWIQKDINQDLRDISDKFNVVVSFAVLEHVLDPQDFIKKVVDSLIVGGSALIVCPDYSSFASKLMGTRWPYFSPGEHLSIPSVKGTNLLLNGFTDINYRVSRICMPYSCRYVMSTLRFKLISNMIPANLTFPFPTGALAIEIFKE